MIFVPAEKKLIVLKKMFTQMVSEEFVYNNLYTTMHLQQFIYIYNNLSWEILYLQTYDKCVLSYKVRVIVLYVDKNILFSSSYRRTHLESTQIYLHQFK